MTQHVVGDSHSVNNNYQTSSTIPDTSIDRTELQSSMPYMTQSGHMTNGHVEMSEINGYKENDGKRGKGKRGKRSSNTSNETPMIDNLLTERMNNSQNSINKFGMDDSYDDMHSSIEFDSGPHREMAIDVPKNFHGAAKTPPRFPSSHSSPRATPKESAKNGKMNSNMPHSEEQMERIRRHQEEIRKRNEREEKRAKEQEFLRASLRRSDKMKALQKERKQQGVDNTAFIDNDDDSGGFEEGYVSGRHTQNSRDYMKRNISYDNVLATLQHINSKVHSSEGREKLKFLTNFFEQRQFRNAVCVHHKVLDVKTRNPPVQCECSNTQDLTDESVDTLCSIQSSESAELLTILNKPHMKSLLYSHDNVARNEIKSSSNDQEPPDEFNNINIPDGTASVKIVHLDKTTEPLGATVRNEGESVIISRIVKGGTAEKSGLLHEGDEILDINGIDMKGKDINDVSEMLANMSGRITFTIFPSNEYIPPSATAGSIMHVKALFNYDPEDDLYIPCRELGVSFMKGDILHIIAQEDPNWWQAYREGEEDYQSLAGLIPSRSFHEQRESMRLQIGAENKENQKKGRSCSCGRANKKKRKKAMMKNDENEEILSYEEVAQYYPEPNRRRPILLIGPGDVGRQELRQRLMESDYDRFAAAIPHTSRPRKVTGPEHTHEIDGQDYHFVSRAQIENDIAGNKFFEHGEFEKNWYGTSVDAVRQVINSGKICVLVTDPESLYMLHGTDLKPYVIFVYPPNIEKLRQIQQRLGVPDIKDDRLRDTIEAAREMEDKFGHYFDHILVNTDMDKAFDELMEVINKIEVEPQWVPVAWTR
ncbi:protein localization to myelin sheath abaxonal region [Mactra antiquata]